jgi:alpha,alpha-trehalase
MCVTRFLTTHGGNIVRYSTGGSIPNLLPRLTSQQLNVSLSVNNTGNVRGHPSLASHFQVLTSFLQMFEKFSIRDIDIGGLGGEYTVQAGFGWTNGVVLWVANTFGGELVAPTCPNPLVEASITGSSETSGSSSKKGNGALQLSVGPYALVGLALLAGLQLLVV